MAGGLTHNKKASVTVDHTKIGGSSGTLTNFPALITAANLPSEMFDSDGASPAQNGGGDIRFTSDEAGTNAIPLEVVSFVTDPDPANGSAEIWVLIPSLSQDNDTIVYVWWNTAGTDSQPAVTDPLGRNAVWADYELVFHGDPANVVDSAGKQSIMALGSPASSNGVYGNTATDFDGVDDVYRVVDSPAIRAQVPMSAFGWLLTSDGGGVDLRNFFWKRNSANEGWGFAETTGEEGRLIWFGIAANDAPQRNDITDLNTRWRRLGVVVDSAGNAEFFDDAASRGTVTVSTNPHAHTNDMGLGAKMLDSAFNGGDLWEMFGWRLRAGTISADWITTEFNNQSDPTSFATAGAVEDVGGGDALVRVHGESVETQEQSAVFRELVRREAEALNTSEGLQSTAGIVRSMLETVETQEMRDVVRGVVRSLVESMESVEALATSSVLLRSVAEILDTTESPGRSRTLARVVGELVEVVEDATRTRALTRSLLEEVWTTETSSNLRDLTRRRDEFTNVSEGTDLARGVTTGIQEIVETGESSSRAIGVTQAVQEALQTAEGTAGVVGLVRALAETLQTLENTRRTRVLTRRLVEELATLEDLTSRRDLLWAVDEDSEVSEALTRASVLVRLLEEELRTQEGILFVRGLMVLVNEGLEVVESFAKGAFGVVVARVQLTASRSVRALRTAARDLIRSLTGSR